jgi:hypothetical protein
MTMRSGLVFCKQGVAGSIPVRSMPQAARLGSSRLPIPRVPMRLPAFVLRCALPAFAATFLATACSPGTGLPANLRAAVVAQAAGDSLTGAMLERWLMKNRQPPGRENANIMLSAWINSTLLIDAIRRQQPLDDSATVDAAIIPDAQRGLAMQYLIARHAKMPAVSERQIDSLLDADDVRVFQVIYLRVPPGNDSARVRPVMERALALQKRISDGADFAAVAREASEDSASRANNGFMPAMTRSQVQRTLSFLWTLGPGQVHPRVSSGPGGLFIFRRATRVESRPGLKTWLAPVIASRADVRFTDSLAGANPVTIAADAASRLRLMAVEPVVATEGPPFATWRGGSLTPAMVRRSTLMLPPADRAAMANGSDSSAKRFLMDLAHREVLMGIITKEPLPTAVGRSMLTAPFRQAIDSLRAAVGRLPAAQRPGMLAAGMIDSSLAGRPRFLPLPGGLAAVLRSRTEVRVDPAAMNNVVRAVRDEWQAAHRDDTTAARGRGPGGRVGSPQ